MKRRYYERPDPAYIAYTPKMGRPQIRRPSGQKPAGEFYHDFRIGNVADFERALDYLNIEGAEAERLRREAEKLGLL